MTAQNEAHFVTQAFTPKQREYLESDARFLLYGGGAGGGKTHIAIIDMLGLNNPGPGASAHPGYRGPRAIDYPEYRGLFLRRTFPQIREVIERTQAIYPVLGADPATGARPVWREAAKMWIFPSGAIIRMGYIDHPRDITNYQGHEYQNICFEELTQWPNSDAWLGLHARLRRVEKTPISIQMRATCNPGGVGHQWVKKFWQISDDGAANYFTVPTTVNIAGEGPVTVELARQFIPALLDENPYLDRVSYAAALEDPTQSDLLKRALRYGRWDIVDLRGVVFANEINSLTSDGHIRDVPYNPRYPVNTFWDLGVADKTAVWFHQRIGGVDYFIDYYEASNRGLKDHWIELKNRGYNFGPHFLPHDANQRKHNLDGAIMTIPEILEGLGMQNIQVAPRIHYLQQGIEQMRAVLPRCYFDSYKTERGIECLTNYSFPVKSDGSIGQEPRHDQYSHGTDAFRGFAQAYNLIDDALDDFQRTQEEEDVPDVPHARRNVLRERQRGRRWKV